MQSFEYEEKPVMIELFASQHEKSDERLGESNGSLGVSKVLLDFAVFGEQRVLFIKIKTINVQHCPFDRIVKELWVPGRRIDC